MYLPDLILLLGLLASGALAAWRERSGDSERTRLLGLLVALVTCGAAVLALPAPGGLVTTSSFVWWDSGPFVASFDRLYSPLAWLLAASALVFAVPFLLNNYLLRRAAPWESFWTLAALLALLIILFAAELIIVAFGFLLLALCLAFLAGTPLRDAATGSLAWLFAAGLVLGAALMGARVAGTGYNFTLLLESGGGLVALLLMLAACVMLGLPPLPWLSPAGASSVPFAAWVLVPWPAFYLLARLAEAGAQFQWLLWIGLAGLALAAFLSWRPTTQPGYPSLALLLAGIAVLAVAAGEVPLALLVVLGGALAGLFLTSGLAGMRLVGLAAVAGLPLLATAQLYVALGNSLSAAGFSGLGLLVVTLVLVTVAANIATVAASNRAPTPWAARIGALLILLPMLLGALLPVDRWTDLLSTSAVPDAFPAVELSLIGLVLLLAVVATIAFAARPIRVATGAVIQTPPNNARLPAWQVLTLGLGTRPTPRPLAQFARWSGQLPAAAGRALIAVGGRYYLLTTLLLALLAIMVVAR